MFGYHIRRAFKDEVTFPLNESELGRPIPGGRGGLNQLWRRKQAPYQLPEHRNELKPPGHWWVRRQS